jgi:hypothetical protein
VPGIFAILAPIGMDMEQTLHRDASTLKPIGSAPCPQYNTEAKFYIDAAHKSGHRHLVVHYEKGGYQGAPEFVERSCPFSRNKPFRHAGLFKTVKIIRSGATRGI